MKKSLLLLIPALFLIASCGDEKQNPELPRHEHIFGTAWKYDATTHFHECDCGEKQGVENHVDSNNDNICEICGFNIPIPPCPEGQHVNNNIDEDMLCDICGYPMEYKHAKSVSGDPTAPFFLKVGEEKEIKATLEPTPERAVEKIFTWKSSNDAIASVEVDPSNTAKAKIVGKKAGKVTFTATNTYNPDTLFRKFEATVVDFDEDNMNLWEYKSEDKSQFGYTSDNRQGVASGTAVLNGLSWEFTRSAAISLNLTKGGMLGFGKGGDPETLVKLVNHNLRKVKSISIETCSANGLAALTVKVGDTTVIEGSTPSSNKDYIPAMSSGDLDSLTGDISIQFDTPAMDPTRVEDETYIKPGSVYIKSIWIVYVEEQIEYKTIKTYDFLDLFENREENHLFDDLSTSSGKPFVIEDENFTLNFGNAKLPASDKGIQDHVLTNGNININIKKTDEVIKYAELKYMVGNSSNSYSLYTSRFGGELFDAKLSEGTESVSAKILDNYVNAVQFANYNTNNVGLISLTIKTISGVHAVVDEVGLTEGAKPDKVKYYVGEVFDPTGLGNINISFTDSSISHVEYPASNLVFYDGQSYEDPADHSGASKILRKDTTYVVANILNTEIKVDIDAVEVNNITFTKIKSIGDLTSGTYLITCPSKKGILQGSADTSSNFGASKYIDYIDSCEFGDEITLNYLYQNELVTFTSDNGIYHISTLSGKNIGMTGSHGVSVAKSPAYPDWTISINDSGLLTMALVDSESTTYYYGYGSTTFKFATTNPENIALYKIAE